MLDQSKMAQQQRLFVLLRTNLKSEGLCPDPTTTIRFRHLRARWTIFWISDIERGRMYSSGREWKVSAYACILINIYLHIISS